MSERELDLDVAEFLATLASERGLAANTLAAYRRDLDIYMAHLADRDATPRDAQASDVSAFMSAMAAAGLARRTVVRRLAAVRGLHRFLVSEGIRRDDPTTGVERPRTPESLPKALDVADVIRLLETPATDTVLGRRDRALLEFMYATGARVSEVVNLDPLDVDLDGGSAMLTGKGDKQRLVLVGRHAVAAIRDYLPDRLTLRRGRPDPGVMFLNARGGPLTRQGVFHILRKHARTAGLDPGKVSPHVLRHSAATHMVEGGADLRTVQELLGHASITTTQIYTRVSPRHLQEVYVASHPRSR